MAEASDEAKDAAERLADKVKEGTKDVYAEVKTSVQETLRGSSTVATMASGLATPAASERGTAEPARASRDEEMGGESGRGCVATADDIDLTWHHPSPHAKISSKSWPKLQ